MGKRPWLPLACALLLIAVPRRCVSFDSQPSLKQTMDGILTRLYATLDEKTLCSLDERAILGLLTETERKALSTGYWCFEVNVPVVVSIVRHTEQQVAPFWLEESGFRKTALVVKNEVGTYEVWQKAFGAGRVDLGINGFDRHRPVYFVCVGPQTPDKRLDVTHVYPPGEAIATMKKGAWIYRDWPDLYIDELPPSLVGQVLLTTYRGRSREAHLVGAFRKTPQPSSARPDQIVLTWSEDPRTTQTIQWRTGPGVKSGLVRYHPRGPAKRPGTETPAQTVLIEDRRLMNDPWVCHHTTVLRGLKPSTVYTYSVGSPSSNTWSEEAEFKTAPGRGDDFSFVTFGDTHRSPDWGHQLRMAAQQYPDVAFYLIAGDLVTTGLYRDEWDRFFAHTDGILNRKPLAFVLGNHDDQDGLGARMPLDLFALPANGPKAVEPERTYSFRYGNALFLMLDVGTSHEVQAAWMEQQLAGTDATWRFAVYHFPLYYYKDDDEHEATRQRWEKVFAKYHLDLMLHGHIHYYIRTRPMKEGQAVASPAEGTIYIVSLGTTDRKPFRQLPQNAEKYLNGGPWYQKFAISGRKLVYQAYDVNGKVCDELTIEK